MAHYTIWEDGECAGFRCGIVHDRSSMVVCVNDSTVCSNCGMRVHLRWHVFIEDEPVDALGSTIDADPLSYPYREGEV